MIQYLTNLSSRGRRWAGPEILKLFLLLIREKLVKNVEIELKAELIMEFLEQFRAKSWTKNSI